METTMENSKENKMGTMPVSKLLINMALPMIISMLVQACYNIVDSIFVAKIKDGVDGANAGTAALNAVGMAFPFQMLLIAFGTGTCVGVNALLSKALGEKNDKRVQDSARNGVFLSFCNFILFFLIGLFLAPFLIKSQGGSGLTLKYGSQYLRIVCMASIGIYTQLIFERLLQSTGRTLCTMFTQLTGAIINIILDPILIFGLCGMPEMKVAGAAVATVIGQICAGILAIILNQKYNKEVRLSFKKFKPNPELIKAIYVIGIPSIVMQAIGSVMTFTMNKLLTGLNPDSVAVFTVYFKLQSLFFMPVFGLNNAMIPMLSYNFGAQKRSRMVKIIKLTMFYAFCFLLIGFSLFEFIPDKLLKIFDTGDASLITLGVPALKIIAFHYLLAWFCIIGGTVFQAIGTSWYSLVVSVARQLVVLLPAAYILSRIGGLKLIWWCFPIAELMSVLMSTIFFILTYKNVISKVPDKHSGVSSYFRKE